MSFPKTSKASSSMPKTSSMDQDWARGRSRHRRPTRRQEVRVPARQEIPLGDLGCELRLTTVSLAIGRESNRRVVDRACVSKRAESAFASGLSMDGSCHRRPRCWRRCIPHAFEIGIPTRIEQPQMSKSAARWFYGSAKPRRIGRDRRVDFGGCIGEGA